MFGAGRLYRHIQRAARSLDGWLIIAEHLAREFVSSAGTQDVTEARHWARIRV